MTSMLLALMLNAGLPADPAALRAPEAAVRTELSAVFPQGEAPAKSPDARWSTEDYAVRELASRDLEDFTGGGAGLILAIVLIVAVVVIVAILIPW
jgi:hypothetical protein